MRNTVILMILAVVLCGCADSYYGYTKEEWDALDPSTALRIIDLHQRQRTESVQGVNQGLQNMMLLDAYGRRNEGTVVYPQQQQDNSTYWQEENARRQYFESIRPKPMGSDWIKTALD